MADQHAVREVFNSPSGISRTSSRTLHPKVPPELKRSPAWLALRVYHVWCMLVGLCITVLTVVEAFLALYVSLFSNPWVSGNQAESMCIAAACLLSAMLLSWGSNVCHAGVMLVFDAARNDAFIVYRALFCLASINSRTGLPVLKTRSTPGLWKARADLAVQCLLLYGPLDLLPILVSLSTGSATDWLVWVAWVSFCEMLLFWVLVCINDYVGKFQALWRLASQERRPRSWTAQMELRPPLLDEETKEEVSEDNICMSGCKWLHGQSSWLALAGLVVLAVVAFAVRSGIALIGSTLLIIFSILHLLQRHCVPGRSLERGAIIASEQDRRSLLASLDDHLCLTQDIELSRGGGVRLLLSAGAQLVDDVGGSDPGMIGYLRTAALGSPVAFRLQSVEPWAVFMETYCGGSPDQIMQGSLVWMVSGAVICSVLFITRHYVEGLCGLAVMVLLSFPAVSLAVCPQYAHLCHACISLGVAVLALLSTACATRGPSYLSFIGICLCAASHCLLPRKIQHKGRASLLFTLIFTAVMSSLISVSLGALVKGELEAPHFLPGTFRFPSDGRMNWWGAENFTAAPCTIQMGTTDDNVLALVDFALFNKLVYMPDHHLEIHLRQWLPGWKMVHQQRREQRCSPSDESCDIQDWTSWFVFQGQPSTALEKTTVVTVRGTKTDLDYILDLDFWSGALMQQVVSNVLLTGPPVSAFLHSALARSWFKGKKVHYDSVLKYLQRRNLAAHPDELIYITGHSLGGGIANLLGAELGIPSIAFSPPGVQSTATLLEINPARLQAMALDIIPDQDPVSRAAGPHGTVQLPIGCADKGAQCHRIFNSVCELFDMCGDQATPRRKLPCDFCPAKIQQRHSLAPHCARHGEPLEPPPVIL